MMVSRVFKKRDEHMKAHEKNMIAMSQNKKLEKEILSNKRVQIPLKIFHTLALF
jgi:hypothetical protein